MLFLTRINPWSIVAEHYKTFYNAATGRIAWTEVVTQLVLACVVVGLVWTFVPKISNEFASALLNFYAIVGGFLVSALFLVVSYGDTITSNRATLPRQELDGIRAL